MTRLSRREREVVERIVAGDSYKEISRAMGIDVRTVGTYALRAYRKIGDAAPRRHRPRESKQALVFRG